MEYFFFFHPNFSAKPPIYKAATAGALGAERLFGLGASPCPPRVSVASAVPGLAAWEERAEGTAGVLEDLMSC